MTKSIRNQQDYTKDILQAAGKDVSDYPRYIKEWWWNHTEPTHLRLNKSGIQFIKKSTNIPVYRCLLPEILKNRTLIQMSRLLTCPYFIQKIDEILLLGEEETVLLKLHADNLQQYLDNLQL